MSETRGKEKEGEASTNRATMKTPPLTNGIVDTEREKQSRKTLEDGEDEKDDSSSAQGSPLALLMSRTGYSIVQQNGQRRYGPPPTWHGLPPKRGCEVFVGKIPRDCFEDELVPIFEKAGRIYEMRLMMDYNGQNRGYAFVVYCNLQEAKEAVKLINNFEIRKVSHNMLKEKWVVLLTTWCVLVYHI